MIRVLEILEGDKAIVSTEAKVFVDSYNASFGKTRAEAVSYADLQSSSQPVAG